MNKVFFSKNGLTSTSANHICNVAKEYIQSITKKLNNINFVNSDIKIIGSMESTPVKLGTNSLNWIERDLDVVAKVKSLIAWLREAIKEKDNETKRINNYSFSDYLKENGIKLPELTESHILTEEEYYNSLSIKERNRYYQLETQAAVIGKYIHPEGEYSSARENLKNKINNPTSVDKNGRDTIIYSHSPSVSADEVDELFFVLQNKHRAIQAQLNQMKHDCEQAIIESKEAADVLSKEEYLEYESARNKAFNEYNIYMNELRSNVKKLKIVIPDSLKEIYEFISSMGKK